MRAAPATRPAAADGAFRAFLSTVLAKPKKGGLPTLFRPGDRVQFIRGENVGKIVVVLKPLNMRRRVFKGLVLVGATTELLESWDSETNEYVGLRDTGAAKPCDLRRVSGSSRRAS